MHLRSNKVAFGTGMELVSRGRQALMSDVSPEFVSLSTIMGFLLVRNSPRMASTESSNRSK